MEQRPAERSDLPEITALLARACVFSRAPLVAEEKLFGPSPTGPSQAQVALDRGRIIGVAAVAQKWIRLLAVNPEHRGHGVGSALLSWAEAHGAYRTLDQPGNYLGPGIDVRDENSIQWLLRRGYRERMRNTNLIVELVKNPAASPSAAQNSAQSLQARGLRLGQGRPSEAALKAIEDQFSAAWRFEAERAGENDTLFWAEDASRRLLGFAAHDGNNRGLGWFGPAGTWPEARGQGIGAALLIQCLASIRAAGHEQCEVAWIGPEEFYRRVCGVHDRREFAVLSKDLLNTQP